jgi:hypothetical protein
VEYSECENLAQKALGFSTAEEVEAYLKNVMRKNMWPDGKEMLPYLTGVN